MASPIELVAPVADDSPAPPGYVTLVSCDGVKFRLPAKVLTKHSKFAEAILSDYDPEEDGEEVELPLDSERGGSVVLQQAVTWMMHHEHIECSRMEVPMPRRLDVAELFSDPWDLEFVRQHLTEVKEEYILCTPQRLYALSLLSVYLQIQSLTDLCGTFFAFYIRKGVRATGEPTKLIRRWFGKDGDYGLDEVKSMTEWVRDSCKGMQLPNRSSE